MRNDIFLKEMANKIKAIRKSKGISGRKLAKMCNLDHSSLGRLETGKRNPYVLTLKIIADALKVDVKDFF